jgi:hypothetical protein
MHPTDATKDAHGPADLAELAGVKPVKYRPAGGYSIDRR